MFEALRVCMYCSALHNPSFNCTCLKGFRFDMHAAPHIHCGTISKISVLWWEFSLNNHQTRPVLHQLAARQLQLKWQKTRCNLMSDGGLASLSPNTSVIQRSSIADSWRNNREECVWWWWESRTTHSLPTTALHNRLYYISSRFNIHHMN